MGIRYYAYPINAADYERARQNPCLFHGDDPLFDAWGKEEDRPDMLYLDKCWQEFQYLFGVSESRPARPAFMLVQGEVEFTSTGWIAFERALSPAQVREVAADLATITSETLRAEISDLMTLRPNETSEQEFDYVSPLLADAKSFVSRLAEQGKGLVYLIG
ncbi:DUF1877 family protein [Subtercola lobariae]|uniref:DUF1877 family protein n=1 Tax=Subtercola lobariae TaxID=1588641 RepID=A0A917EXK3_9MICO|nr:DUF1877 family protein [Subtercola lobariae]GGF27078.1 hypothetical protein GCM10011399_20510 [Subtercola lobariae]